MKRFYLFLAVALVGLVATLSSCSSNDADEDPVLDVAQSSVLLGAEGDGRTVTVNASGSYEVTIENNSAPGEAWITAEKSGSGVLITAQPNNSSDVRTASVVLSLGSLHKTIAVTQAAVQGSIVLEQEVYVLPYSGTGSTPQAVNFTATPQSTDVRLATEAAWITDVQYAKGSNTFSFKVAVNNSATTREAKFIISAGATTQEVTIEQEGSVAFLPFLKMNTSVDEVKTQEAERGSKLDREGAGSILGGYTILFTPQSDIFTQIHYRFGLVNGAATNTIAQATLVAKNKDLANDAAFIKALTDRGYTETEKTPNGYPTYTNENAHYRVSFERLTLDPGFEMYVYFKFVPYQQDSYETFKDVPGLQHIGVLANPDKGVQGKTLSEIVDYEKTLGGTIRNQTNSSSNPKVTDGVMGSIDPSKRTYISFTTKDSDKPIYRRFYEAYYVKGSNVTSASPYLGKVYRVAEYLKDADINYVVWTYSSSVYVTREFKALMEDKGYKLEETVNPTQSGGDFEFRFHNASTGLYLYVVVWPSQSGGAYDTVQLNTFYEGSQAYQNN